MSVKWKGSQYGIFIQFHDIWKLKMYQIFGITKYKTPRLPNVITILQDFLLQSSQSEENIPDLCPLRYRGYNNEKKQIKYGL